MPAGPEWTTLNPIELSIIAGGPDMPQQYPAYRFHDHVDRDVVQISFSTMSI